NRSPTMWSLSVKRLSGEELPPVLGIYTGNENSLLSVIEPYLIEHNAPFQKNNDMAGRFDKTSEAVKSWLQSREGREIEVGIASAPVEKMNSASSKKMRTRIVKIVVTTEELELLLGGPKKFQIQSRVAPVLRKCPKWLPSLPTTQEVQKF
ncbi:hypothetical protein L195_g017171, partial [Trifolium pratense]